MIKVRKQELLFLQKKKQKNSHYLRALAPRPPKPAGNKSFLLLFFKKEVLAFFLCFFPFAAHATNIAAVPIGRQNLPWWQARFTTTLAEAKTTPNAKIIWLGDSITQFWQRTGPHGYDNILPIWQKYYAPYNALDFGFVGDTTSSLLWRLDHGQVASLHPSLAIILIGANNLGHPHWPASLTTPGIEAVVTKTHTLLPTTHILLLGVLPSIRSPWVDTQTKLINQSLAQAYANNATVTFIDVSPVLTTNGHADPALYIDPKETPPRPALHPDAAGMSRIAAYLAPTVQHFVSLPSVASRQSSEPSDN
jgi:lysophospholipase L1-like esterase